MFVLDTDTLSYLQGPDNAIRRRVERRMESCGQPVAVTMVSFSEQLKGRLAGCAAARTPEEYVTRLAWLRRTVEDYQTRTVLDFDDAAAVEFRTLKAAKVRVGTMDLRIASIALAISATVVTANLSDFRQVPNLKLEDWTAE